MYARLSRSALEALDVAELEAKQLISGLTSEDGKAECSKIGAELLEKYMSILGRSGAMLTSSYCQSPSLLFWME